VSANRYLITSIAAQYEENMALALARSSCPDKSAKRVFALDDPGIHALLLPPETWMAGSSPAMTMESAFVAS
jgi:hypothetical protein